MCDMQSITTQSNSDLKFFKQTVFIVMYLRWKSIGKNIPEGVRKKCAAHIAVKTEIFHIEICY